MSTNADSGLLAIDIGSSRVKLGWFPPAAECTSTDKPSSLPIAGSPLPQPDETLAVSHGDDADLRAEISNWLKQVGATESQRFVASVNPAVMPRVQAVFSDSLQPITFEHVPIEKRVDHPERVGIDRLLNAVAANRLRQPERPAIVVDCGTACTVDLVSADGAFEGGAILPGMSLSATALHAGTAQLPQLPTESFDATPAAVGKSTQAAMTAGLYWGTVGAVRELIDRVGCDQSPLPQLFITGGAASRLVPHLAAEEQSIRHIPSLVLSGIAIVAEELT